MVQREDTTSGNRGVGRRRSRIRGFLASPGGRTASVATIVTPLIGWAIHDFLKPDSTLRRIGQSAVNRYLEYRKSQPQLVEVPSNAEVVTGED